jgi:hypothetical protein
MPYTRFDNNSEIILTSEQSFLNLGVESHRELFNKLIDFSELLGRQSQLSKIEPFLIEKQEDSKYNCSVM